MYMRFLGIYTAILSIIFVFPLMIVFAVSFDPGNYIRFPITGFSVKWYVMMWSNETIILALYNSIIVGFFSSIVGAMVAIPAALGIMRGGKLMDNFIYPYFLSSFTVPWLVYGLALLFFWGASGYPLTLFTIIVGHTVIAIPYILRVTLAVLTTMPPNLVKASRICGAGPYATFFLVTLPYIKSGLIAGISFAFVISFTNIPVSLFITTADNITLPIAIFNYMVNNFEPMVAAISTVQVLLIGLILLVARKVSGKESA